MGCADILGIPTLPLRTGSSTAASLATLAQPSLRMTGRINVRHHQHPRFAWQKDRKKSQALRMTVAAFFVMRTNPASAKLYHYLLFLRFDGRQTEFHNKRFAIEGESIKD